VVMYISTSDCISRPDLAADQLNLYALVRARPRQHRSRMRAIVSHATPSKYSFDKVERCFDTVDALIFFYFMTYFYARISSIVSTVV